MLLTLWAAPSWAGSLGEAQLNLAAPGGFPHKMDLVLPNGANEFTPIIVALHGGGGTKEDFAYNLSLKRSAKAGLDDYNFAFLNAINVGFLFIQGQTLQKEATYGWTNNIMVSGQNDKKMLIEVSKKLKNEMGFKKVFLMGHSMGGTMTNRMWCEAPQFFDGYGSSSGPMSKINFETCDPKVIKPYIHTTGLNDRIIQIKEENSVTGKIIDHSKDLFLSLEQLTLLAGGRDAFPIREEQFANELRTYPYRADFMCRQNAGVVQKIPNSENWQMKVQENCGGKLKMIQYRNTDHCLRFAEGSNNSAYKCDIPLNGNENVGFVFKFIQFFLSQNQ